MRQSALTGWKPEFRSRPHRGVAKTAGEVLLAVGWIALFLSVMGDRAQAASELWPIVERLCDLVSQVIW